MNQRHAIMGVVSLIGAASSCQAWEFRCRFVERIGNMDVPLAGNTIETFAGAPRNVRIQFGVFDDANGPAPLGGFVGWNVGTLQVSGPVDNSDERRTNGRIAPFNFSLGANANGNPPLPQGDPFTMLTDIDSTLGTQSPVWVCRQPPGPVPEPQPPAVVRGLNTFVSVYAITIDPSVTASSYTVTAGGNLIAASEWRTVGNPIAPDCGDPDDPSDDIEGAITYAPLPVPVQAFSCVLQVIVPAPMTGLLGVAGVLLANRRRRSTLGMC